MDEELIQIESELRRLSPARVPLSLERRILGKLGSPAVLRRRSRVSRLGWWLALPVAAAVVVLVLWPEGFRAGSGPGTMDRVAGRPEPVPAAVEAPYKPVAADNVLVSARDEGLVTLADGTTARRQRLQFVDTIIWRDPRTNASITWSLPREEVRVVPVVYH